MHNMHIKIAVHNTVQRYIVKNVISIWKLFPDTDYIGHSVSSDLVMMHYIKFFACSVFAWWILKYKVINFKSSHDVVGYAIIQVISIPLMGT